MRKTPFLVKATVIYTLKLLVKQVRLEIHILLIILDVHANLRISSYCYWCS